MQDENANIVSYNAKMFRFSGIMAGVSFSMILLLVSKEPLDIPLTVAMWIFSFLLPFHAAIFLHVNSKKKTEKESEAKQEPDLLDTMLAINFIFSCILFVLGIGFVIYHVSIIATIAFIVSIVEYIFVYNAHRGKKVPQPLKDYVREL